APVPVLEGLPNRGLSSMPASLSSTEFESETRPLGNPDSVKTQHALAPSWSRWSRSPSAKVFLVYECTNEVLCHAREAHGDVLQIFDLCSPPFRNKDHAIQQIGYCGHIDVAQRRGQIDNHAIIGGFGAGQQTAHMGRTQNFRR